MPIIHAEPLLPASLPGTYYVRVSFEGGDERGHPFYPPVPDEDHLEAYRPFLHASKQEAIDAFIREEGGHFEVEPAAPLGLKEPPPIGEGNEYICMCRVDEEGEVDCVRRVAHLDAEAGIVTLVNWDEDFLISWPRDYIFEVHEMSDPCAPKLAM